jgi:hypothetical protein
VITKLPNFFWHFLHTRTETIAEFAFGFPAIGFTRTKECQSEGIGNFETKNKVEIPIEYI